jgi:hypothetical protein
VYVVPASSGRTERSARPPVTRNRPGPSTLVGRQTVGTAEADRANVTWYWTRVPRGSPSPSAAAADWLLVVRSHPDPV